MSTPYTADYFIEKFSKIPDGKWCTGEYSIGEKHCALGHCGMRSSSEETDESKALEPLFGPTLAVGFVNDGLYEAFQQPTPKARILAALRFIKEKGAK